MQEKKIGLTLIGLNFLYLVIAKFFPLSFGFLSLLFGLITFVIYVFLVAKLKNNRVIAFLCPIALLFASRRKLVTILIFFLYSASSMFFFKYNFNLNPIEHPLGVILSKPLNYDSYYESLLESAKAAFLKCDGIENQLECRKENISDLKVKNYSSWYHLYLTETVDFYILSKIEITEDVKKVRKEYLLEKYQLKNFLPNYIGPVSGLSFINNTYLLFDRFFFQRMVNNIDKNEQEFIRYLNSQN